MNRANVSKRRKRRQRGAVLLEFALLLPVLVSLLLGVTTGGITLWHKLTMTGAAREAARFGATLPVDNNLPIWLMDIGDIAIGAASGVMDAGEQDRTVCVAYVSPGSELSDQTTRYILAADDTWEYEVGQPCFADGRPSSERRVQIQLNRTSQFQAGFFSNDVGLDAKASVRFERFES